ncbi:MAG: ATP-binding protein [Bryobacterales bacterium]|nr:ATP-binding protein [Bryobacterales bacterium]
MRYVQSLALEPRKRNTGTNRESFRFHDMAGRPSTFTLQFICDGKHYEYGLNLDDEGVFQEWLFRINGGKHRSIYQRVTSAAGEVKIELPKAAKPKLAALATVGGPPNQTFLATVQATLDPEDFGPDLAAVLTWFKSTLCLIAPDESFVSLAHAMLDDPGLLTFAGEFLKTSSTGVDRLEVTKTEVTEEQLNRLLQSRVWQKILADAKGSEDGAPVRLGDGHEIVAEREGGSKIYQMRIQAAHEQPSGTTVPLELDEESDGTRRLLNLLPALHRLRSGSGVYFIDEIDRSLHPILVRAFLEFFLKNSAGGPSQIIVTTHESSLLDQNLLRRDEIWFAEKDHQSATRLYSLLDFKVRNDMELRKHYLQGRFGAVPFIGGLDNLIPQVEERR